VPAIAVYRHADATPRWNGTWSSFRSSFSGGRYANPRLRCSELSIGTLVSGGFQSSFVHLADPFPQRRQRNAYPSLGHELPVKLKQSDEIRSTAAMEPSGCSGWGERRYTKASRISLTDLFIPNYTFGSCGSRSVWFLSNLPRLTCFWNRRKIIAVTYVCLSE
jgi:hypothetical protein